MVIVSSSKNNEGFIVEGGGKVEIFPEVLAVYQMNLARIS